MKLLHTSDWHLGRLNSNRTIEEDQKYFIDQIIDIVKERDIDAVLLAGDIYDRSIANPDAIRLFDYATKRLITECGTRVLAIAGNHDGAARVSAHSELLMNSGFYIIGALKKDIDCYENDEVQVFLLPWISTDKVSAVYPEHSEDITDTQSAYKLVCDKIRERFAPNKKHILVSHSYIAGAETSTSDRSAEIGTASMVEASIFDGFDYVALGHIHKPYNITDSIRYCGTPMPYAFGKEEKQEKSVTIIDTDDMSQEIIPLKLLHKRITLNGTYDELLNTEYPDDITNAYIRVELTDAYMTLETMNIFQGKFPNVIEFKGKAFENEESSITLSIEQLEEMESDPMELFKQFYRERTLKEADEHALDLFAKAIEESEREGE